MFNLKLTLDGPGASNVIGSQVQLQLIPKKFRTYYDYNYDYVVNYFPKHVIVAHYPSLGQSDKS